MSSSPYLRHLKSSKDLETTYEATRAGFVALALEKNRRATPYVSEARALQEAASQATIPTDLLKIKGIEAGLLTAAGLSDKSLAHLVAKDKKLAIKGLIKNFLEPSGAKFVEELVFRFLLTRGDTLGGFNEECRRCFGTAKTHTVYPFDIEDCRYSISVATFEDTKVGGNE